jgi:hypothetical protein
MIEEENEEDSEEDIEDRFGDENKLASVSA